MNDIAILDSDPRQMDRETFTNRVGDSTSTESRLILKIFPFRSPNSIACLCIGHSTSASVQSPRMYCAVLPILNSLNLWPRLRPH
jgi:hypothetical protein